MQDITLFNSLGGQKEKFTPLVPNEVSIYCCGPTVYNDPHVGNFRPVIVFDCLRRLFIHDGYKVTFVSNYTDVDDKIINRAKELGITEKELTDSVIEEYRRLVSAVGSLQPDVTPRPTVYMDKIISYVDDLVKNGSAYAVDGDVYLRVRKIKDYGELSGNTIESLESGARIDVNKKKEDPLDFALWKKTEDGIKWASPWGEGRPGWHTECCVMINSIFSKQNGLIDIHGGGFDLKFPHHENEMAQAKAHNGNKLARYWIHNGFINMGEVKMSKSLGNVVLMKNVVEKFGGLPFRLLVLASYYRSPASFSEATMAEATKKYSQLEISMKKASISLQLLGQNIENLPIHDESAVLPALRDDLNTPNALAALYEENKDLNNCLRTKPVDTKKLLETFAKVYEGMEVLGLNPKKTLLSDDDKKLYMAYDEAKEKKDFAMSDKIRGELIAKGIF